MAERAAAVKNLIVQAQKQDASGDEQGAYRHYLLCVQAISQLLHSALPGSQGELSQQKTKQLYQMAKQCLDRSESILESVRTAADEAQRQRATSTLSCTVTPPIPAPRRLVAWTGDPGAPLSGSVQPNPTSPAAQPTIAQSPRGTVQRQPHVVTKQVSQPSHLHHLTPIQAATLKNKLLMEQYQAHIRTASSSNVSPSFQGLEHLRRLNENMSVARIQERMAAQKQKLNEMRAQNSSKSSPQVRLDALSISELSVLVAKYNQEHGKLYLNVPNSQHHDSQKVYNFVNEILSSSDHPLARLMVECQNNVLAALRPVVMAVHSLNGLPYIEIKLAGNSHQDYHSGSQTGHCSTQKPHYPEEDDAAHMDLMFTEEDLPTVAGPEAPPPDHVILTETPPTHQDILADKLSRLRSALLGDDGRVEGGVKEECAEVERRKGEDRRVNSDSTRLVSAEGSYCLQGPETISPQCEVGVQREGRTPGASSLGDAMACPDSVPHGPELECPGSVPDGPDSIPHVSGSTSSTSPTCHIPNTTRHDPDFTPGGPVPIPNSVSVEPDSTPGAPASTLENTCSPGVTGPQSTEETLGQYAMLGPEAKAGEAVDGSRHEEEEGCVFRSLPPLVCTLHAERESEMVELEKRYGDVLKGVFKQIHSSLNKLEAGLTHAYPWIGTEENTEYCQAVLEANFFPIIMPHLQTAFRCIKYTDEVAVARSMCQHVNATPKDLSVRRKFWLLEQAHAPFGEAIEEVRQIPQAVYMSPKLGALVRMSKSIVQCIEAYFRAQGKPTVDLAVGVDDMLPIMTYIILRSAKPDLVSECALMEEFIQEGYMKGEEGFCLTSFRTALLFIGQMSS